MARGLGEYQKRVTSYGAYWKSKNNTATTDEHEKWGLPETFSSYIGGDYAGAIEAMQARDLQAGRDHEYTNGFDFYWCFTLKGQAHKYFYYGDEFNPDYKANMLAGAKAWTAVDPRPSLELIGLLESQDQEVVALVSDMMGKFWRSPADVKAMAEEAIGETIKQKALGEYLLSIADQLPASQPTTIEGWNQWWALIAAQGHGNN